MILQKHKTVVILNLIDSSHLIFYWHLFKFNGTIVPIRLLYNLELAMFLICTLRKDDFRKIIFKYLPNQKFSYQYQRGKCICFKIIETCMH